MNHNTLLIRLAGPVQSWGTDSRLQLRRTDPVPSKSAVIGLILCAMGKKRREAAAMAQELSSLRMGVRVDRAGRTDWDYHTVGAGYGIRQAEGGIKYTASTKEPETLLSRRQYLWDASFLVALQGNEQLIGEVANAFLEPVWPIFLGRKCCIPSEPVFAGTANHPDLPLALASIPLVDHYSGRVSDKSVEIPAYLEHEPVSNLPTNAFQVNDAPRFLENPSHGPRWVVPTKLMVPVVADQFMSSTGRRGVNYASSQWKLIREKRLSTDNFLCVFCKCQAEDVHHVTYERAGNELIEDLRSLCKICHDACTQLEYGSGMMRNRIDPADPESRNAILGQVRKLLSQRRNARRKAIRESAALEFLDNVPDAGTS